MLVTALGERVFKLYVGREGRSYSAHLELAKIGKNADADATILGFCTLIRLLPKAERKLWNSATMRELNIGVQAAMRPTVYQTVVSAEAVKAASDVSARIVFTVYAPRGRGSRARNALGKSSK